MRIVFAAMLALASLHGVGRAKQATPPVPPGESPWWKTMARNYWSPQNAVAGLVGTDAVDCGQFGPEVTEAQVAHAIARTHAAARDHKAFFFIRHFLGPEEDVVRGRFMSRKWLAEGLSGTSDGFGRRFDYEGFYINILLDVVPPPLPKLTESSCPAPHASGDSTGLVTLACGTPS